MTSPSTKPKHPDVFVSELEGLGRHQPKITAAPPTPAEIDELVRTMNMPRDLLENWKPVMRNIHIRNIDLPGGKTSILCSMKSTADKLPRSFEYGPVHPAKTKTGKKWKPPYEIAQAGEKGLGMFATRAIERGSPILFEYPAITIPGMPPQPLITQLRRIIQERMDPDLLQTFMTLSNSKRPDECPPEIGILRTNGIGITLPMSAKDQKIHAEHSAMFLDTSRCNHSCGCNAEYAFDVKSFQLQLKAKRRILPGEEITVRYTETHEPRADRRAKLKAMYRFDCNCPYCDLPDEAAVAESDRRREMLANPRIYFPDFEDWSPRYLAGMTKNTEIKDIYDFIARHKQGNEFREKEGFGETSSHNFQLQNAYGALGDTSNFTKYVKKTIAACRAAGEPTGVRLAEMMLQNPQVQPHWGSLKKTQDSESGGK